MPVLLRKQTESKVGLLVVCRFAQMNNKFIIICNLLQERMDKKSVVVESEVKEVADEKVSGSSKSENRRKNSSEGSRSRDKNRSRSKETKKKHKKHKNKSRRRSSSSSSSLKYRRSRSRDRKRSKDRKKYIDRGRSRDRKRNKQYRDPRNELRKQPVTQAKSEKLPLQIPMPHIPTEVPMPEMPGERRRRQRSRSPLDYYRKNQNNHDGEFWDSFSWQPRINYTPNVSTSALANTKKMRRLMITNIPYEMGITEDNLRDLITRFMSQNYLKDQMNNCPVKNLEINEADHNVAVELSSVEETCRMCRMEKIQLFKGMHNGIVRLGDSIYGNSVLTQAQTAGQAQAAAFAAINVIENKKTNFTIDSLSSNESSSTVIRVTNALTSYMAAHLTVEQWQDYYEDLLEGFSQFGTVVHSWLVKESEKEICADPGNMFIEFEYKENAEAAMSEMQGRMYDERSIQLFYIPRDVYYKNFRPNITPPTLPPPLKTTKPK